MKAAIDNHFVQKRTKFDMEMIKSHRLVLQPVLVFSFTVDHNDDNPEVYVSMLVCCSILLFSCQ